MKFQRKYTYNKTYTLSIWRIFLGIKIPTLQMASGLCTRCQCVWCSGFMNKTTGVNSTWVYSTCLFQLRLYFPYINEWSQRPRKSRRKKFGGGEFSRNAETTKSSTIRLKQKNWNNEEPSVMSLLVLPKLKQTNKRRSLYEKNGKRATDDPGGHLCPNSEVCSNTPVKEFV